MKLRISDLWSLRGSIDRGPYAFWGIVLALLKYNLDRVVVTAQTGRVFRPKLYWVPGDLFGILPTTADRARAALPMLLVALPFIYTGVALTLRRLRSANLPAAGVLLFFVPLVNLLFFGVLCALPARTGEGAVSPHPRSGFLAQWIPRGRGPSAAVALAIVLPLTSGLAVLGAHVLGSYGWGLFVGLPFFLGLTSALVHGYHAPRSLGSCIWVSAFATFLLAGVLIALAVEGFLCVLMAAPLAMALSVFGALVGYSIQRRPEGGRDAGRVVASLVVLLPGAFGAEKLAAEEPALLEVTSVVEVDAPPERVWQHVIAFAELPPPKEWLFRAGVAYPLRAEIDGCGPGAVRHCVFSTGAFVEPIEVWDEPRRLEFSVAAQPPTMRELSPYPEITPPHLERYLASQRGRFELAALPGGRTHLSGTTWYTNRMWPARYWRLWSDEIIHRIHVRVLEHIRERAEAG